MRRNLSDRAASIRVIECRFIALKRSLDARSCRQALSNHLPFGNRRCNRRCHLMRRNYSPCDRKPFYFRLPSLVPPVEDQASYAGFILASFKPLRDDLTDSRFDNGFDQFDALARGLAIARDPLYPLQGVEAVQHSSEYRVLVIEMRSRAKHYEK